MNPRILLTRRWPAAAEQQMAEMFNVKLNIVDAPLSESALRVAMQEFDAICPTVSDRLPASIFENESARVKMIGNFGVGYNHIDVEAARRAGVIVSNTPGVLTDATADLAMTLILMAARRAGEGERELRAGLWRGWRPTHMLGLDIAGKTLGLVGFGRIGQALAQRAHFGFGMRVAYFARGQAQPDIEAVTKAKFVPELADLLACSDVVSLHVPGGVKTKHMIDRKMLGHMKNHAILVNTARGDVVEEEALSAALSRGTIRAAGLDVYGCEPDVPKALLALENVVLLPHLGSATEEARLAMGLRVLENLKAFFAGHAPPDRVV